MQKLLFVAVIMGCINAAFSQVGINTTTPNAQLEIRSSNQATPNNNDGLLIPKIDTFPATNPTALQQGMLVYLTTTVGLNTPGFYYWDNTTTSWIAINGATDSDWYEVGSTTSPNDINDNMYHLGNIAIGKNTANYPFEVAATNEDINVNLDLVANTNGAERIGILNSISGTSNDDFSFVKNNIFGTGTGYKYGLNNVFNSTSNGAHYGLYNDFQNANAGKMGVYNSINGSGIGYYNFFQGPDNGAKYGSYTQFNSDYGSGNSDWVGHSVSFDYVTTIGNTGNKYGFAVAIPPAVGGGAHFGVYSYAGNLTIGYAGYFSGRVSIGDTTLDTDHYILPISRGTAGQIMQTDGSGNVTWQNPNVAIGNSFWSTTGNSGTNATTNFIGTTDDVDFVFRRNNIMSGIISTFNTALGSDSFSNNTSGTANTAIGSGAMNYNTSGGYNTAVGFSSLGFNTTGIYNTAIGNNSLRYNSTGNRNTATGSSSLFYNTTGRFNTATGFNSLYNNTTGENNSAHGFQSLFSNTTGIQNSATGQGALFSNTTGATNVANGYFSLYSNTIGASNTAFGCQSIYRNTIGNYNTAAGFYALHFMVNGSNNTAVGTYTIYNLISGSDNTAIGFGAYTVGDFNNSTALGANTNITASNQIRLGNNAVTSIGGFANWTNVSDKRFKKNIQENVPGLSFITKLKPVTYSLDLDAINSYLKLPQENRKPEFEIEKRNEVQTGFLAQDVEKTAKDLGFEFSGVDKPKNNEDYYGLRYAEFVVPLVKAVQEQQGIIDNQNTKIQTLEESNQKQELKINSLEERLAKLESLLNNKQ